METETTTEAPELTLTIDGKEYGFSELDEPRVEALETWLLARTPHPLDALKGHMDGLTKEQQDKLFDRAMDRVDSWPPKLNEISRQSVILRTDPGRREFLHAALTVHQPHITRAETKRVYQWLAAESDRVAQAQKDADEEQDPWATSYGKIFNVAFGRSYLLGRGE